MNGGEAGELLATLKANYPREQVGKERVTLWVQMLADLPADEGKEAVLYLMANEVYFPTVAALRRCVAERRLGLPDTAAAWEQVDAWARWQVTKHACTECAGTGDSTYDRALPCTACRGVGALPDENPVVLAAPVQRAAELVGGKHGIRTAENPSILRSQFTKAYLQFREEAVQVVVVPAALQLAAVARREALTASMPMPELGMDRKPTAPPVDASNHTT